MVSEQAFAPLPLKARSTLEILDISVKLYKRYFVVLMLWSLIVAASYIANIFTGVASLLTIPLVYSSVSCALAAAVRGQRISFGQVWEFTKPRFGALIGVTLLTYLLIGIIFLAATIAFGLLFFGAVAIFDNLPEAVIVVGVILGIFLGLIMVSVVSVLMFGWLNMVPIVICMEDNHRGVSAIGRAWNLVSGHWKRVTFIAFLLGISLFIGFLIVGGFSAMAFGLGSFLSSSPDLNELLLFTAGATFVTALFTLFWTPAQTLVVAVLYLDLRVRKEALDLEWGAYSSTPKPQEMPQQEIPRPEIPQYGASTPGGAPSIASTAFQAAVSPSEPAAPFAETTTTEQAVEEPSATLSNTEAAPGPPTIPDLPLHLEKPAPPPAPEFPTSTFGVPAFQLPDAPREEKP